MADDNETGCPFKVVGNSMTDKRGRIVLALKGKGWVFSRYPDMSETEKKALLAAWDSFPEVKADGQAKDFMGQPQSRQEMEVYLNFKDVGKGDLCG